MKGISLGSLALGEASCHVMRIIRLLRGEAHVVGSPANSQECAWKQAPALLKLSDHCGPSREPDCNLMRDPKPELSR